MAAEYITDGFDLREEINRIFPNDLIIGLDFRCHIDEMPTVIVKRALTTEEGRSLVKVLDKYAFVHMDRKLVADPDPNDLSSFRDERWRTKAPQAGVKTISLDLPNGDKVEYQTFMASYVKADGTRLESHELNCRLADILKNAGLQPQSEGPCPCCEGGPATDIKFTTEPPERQSGAYVLRDTRDEAKLEPNAVVSPPLVRDGEGNTHDASANLHEHDEHN